MAVVDLHSHFIPSSVVEHGVFGVRAGGGELAHPEGFRYPAHPEFFDVPAKLAGMDAAGIDVAVLSLSPTLFFYDRDADEAIEFARTANDALAEMVAASERLLGFAHLPLQDPQAAAAELDRCVVELGFRGAHIGTSAGPRELDDPELEPVFAAADRHAVPLMLHPTYVGPKPGLEAYYLTNTLGNPIDTTVAAARLIHAGTLDRHPSAPVVLVHAGGFLPFQIGRLDHAHARREEPRARLADPPSTRLERFWFDSITHDDAALAFLAGRVTTERIVLGTDVPFDMGDERPLERLRRAGVDPEELGATAGRLLGLA